MKDKITVGVLIGNICASYSDDLLDGLVHRAEDADCDVRTIFFMGAHANCFDELYYYEGGNKEQKYLFQYNTVFDYAKVAKLDVIIAVFSSFYLYMGETKEQFFQRFADLEIPIIVVGDEYKDYISVNSDNGDGIRKCMEHLIKSHGCKKIAYLGGPKENNRDARERLNAYYQVMEENGLPIEEGMIAYGDYSANSAPLFGKLLDDNPGIEAVVCANDTMALSGYEECKKRGLIPGTDIAITGFDDILEAKSVVPALTTVEQNAYDLGYMAMKIAEKVCQEDSNVESVKIPVYFKHRESCGKEKVSFEVVLPEISKLDSCEEIAKRCSREILDNVSLYRISIVEDHNIQELLYRMFYHIAQVYLSEQETEYDMEFIDVSMHTLINSQKFAMDEFITEFCRQMANIIFSGEDLNRKKRLSGLILHILDYTQNITV
ncbi:MAG: substrate-binding domain-containing protein, partial [Firmicutes bacterium]|nr:substrate-binding domain-containing protein [Bacillota bacterium]